MARIDVIFRLAVEAGRSALRDMEPDQIPVNLRRVASYQGGTLPPPFAKSLLAELGRDDDFRGRARDAWQGGAPPSGGAALASYLFLTREPGWVFDLVGLVYEMGAAAGASSDETLQIERDALAADNKAIRERLRQARARTEELTALLREARERERAPQRSEAIAVQRAEQALAEAQVRHDEEVAVLREGIASLEKRVVDLQEEARSARRERGEAEAARQAMAGGDSLRVDADELARRLDEAAELASLLAPVRAVAAGEVESPGGEPAGLPHGVPPDHAEAVDWLTGAGSRLVLVDGYNVGFQIAGSDPMEARAVVKEAVGRLTAAGPDLAAVVVFDSSEADEAGGDWGERLAVRYTDPDHTADDEIVALAAESAGPVVVVTNDRELRERAESKGAVVLWSAALVEWSRRR